MIREFATGIRTLLRGFGLWRTRPGLMMLGLISAIIAVVVEPPNTPAKTGTYARLGRAGCPIQRGNTVSRKPKMNIASMPYCVNTACAQPA